MVDFKFDEDNFEKTYEEEINRVISSNYPEK